MDDNKNFYDNPPVGDNEENKNGFKKPGDLYDSKPASYAPEFREPDNGEKSNLSEDGSYRMAHGDLDNLKETIYERTEPKGYSDFNTSGEDYNGEFETVNTHETAPPPEFYNTNIKKKKRKMPIILVVGIIISALFVLGAFALRNPVIREEISKLWGSESEEKTGATTGSAIVATATATRDGQSVLTTPEIVDKVGPAVVGVINTSEVSREGLFYGFFGGGVDVQKSNGSGVIISENGFIITNNHVVEGATEITVVLSTGEEYIATLIGADSKTDLAVLKIDASGLTFASMGSSSDLRVGDTAIAIGNPLGQEFAGTTTQGIISGLNRTVVIDNKELTLIQTDAAINPGNSGGALVDAYGHLVGINTAKISSAALEGLGFAIPIDEAKPIIQELIDNGYVSGRPILGIGGINVTEQEARANSLKVGVYVTSMTSESPAYTAGVKVGDTIVECNGQSVATVDDINQIKNQYKPGDELKLKVYRQNGYKDITVVLGEEVPLAD